jgi:hypothetical protein
MEGAWQRTFSSPNGSRRNDEARARVLGPGSPARLTLGLATGFHSTAGPRASRAGSGPRGGGGVGAGAGSGPVRGVAADAADAAGNRRRRRIFKRITNKEIPGYNKDIYR